jgi:hypothetical protein
MIDRRGRARSESSRDADAACGDRRCSSSKPAARSWWRRLRPAHAACLTLAGFAALGGLTLLPGRDSSSMEPSPVLADSSAGGGLGATVRSGGAGASARQLLLSSHGRLQWLDVDSGAATVVHEGRGVYYGTLPADEPGRVWVVSRPHNWRTPPEGSTEQLLLIDTASGELLKEVPLPSQFTHDAIRHGDKARGPCRPAHATQRAPRSASSALTESPLRPLRRRTWRTRATAWSWSWLSRPCAWSGS